MIGLISRGILNAPDGKSLTFKAIVLVYSRMIGAQVPEPGIVDIALR